ncbi:MAG: radical SAM protein, partial [Candidatus Dadabacteria bacterium]
MNVVFAVPPSGKRRVARDLLHGCWCWGARIGGATFPPTGLAVLATLLRRMGIAAHVVDPAAGQTADWGRVDWVVVLTSTPAFRSDAEWVLALKRRHPRLRALWFGAHPTFRPRDVLASEAVDRILVGEPEVALPAFFRCGTAVGVYGKERLGGERMSLRWAQRPADLDALPVADRGLLADTRHYPNPFLASPYATMTTSRGCPGRCRFCTVPAFYGRRYRAQSAGRVVDEMSALARAGVRRIFFRDEEFGRDEERVAAICEEILRRGVKVSWICSLRADSAGGETLRLMRRAGCRMVRIGVESGSQRTLDRAAKGITLDDVRRTFRACRDAGLRTHAHFILGLPGETDSDIRKTVRFALELRPTYATFGWFYPFPGSAWGQRAAVGQPPGDLEGLHYRSV